MEDKDSMKMYRDFKICRWLFVLSAIILLISIICTAVTKEMSMVIYIMDKITLIMYSLFCAFVLWCIEILKED